MSDKTVSVSAFDSLKCIVGKDLSDVTALLLSIAKSHDAALIDSISSHILSAGGKRIRPMLCLAFANFFNATGVSHIYLAAAIECIHTATLLHDDVIDKSETRRGVKTANNIWGDKASILVGDFLFSQAFKLMVKTESIASLDSLSNTSAIISEAEVMQLNEIGNIEIGLDFYIKLINAKTAQLFAAASSIGAMSGNASPEFISLSHDYGKALGMCFQVVDDILDYTSDQASFGKKPGNDFYEGKVTAPLIFAMENASSNDRSEMKLLFKNRVAEGAFERIKSLIIKNGGIERSMKLSQDYCEQGLEVLKALPNAEIKESLRSLLSEAIVRTF